MNMKLRNIAKALPKKDLPTFLVCICCGCCNPAIAQNAITLAQANMHKWKISPANYSGITHIEGNSYAVVSDKEAHSGFYIFNIDIDLDNGKIRNVSRSELYADKSSQSGRDEEGICFCAPANTLFISAEDDQQIKEYDLDGNATGRKLNVPEMFAPDSIFTNFGFESLTYDSVRRHFYAATERPLKCDIQKDSSTIRIIEFGLDMNPAAQYSYMLESPSLGNKGKHHIHGVSEITALPDGKLIVMERELNVTKEYIGSECRIRLFEVNLSEGEQISPSDVPISKAGHKPLYKTAIADFTTRISLTKLNFTNYEGMCLGPKLKDGRQTLLLINDSQAGAGNPLYRLKDYIKVIIL